MKKVYIKPVFATYLVSSSTLFMEGSNPDAHDRPSTGDDLSKGTGGSGMWEYMDGDDD